MADRTLTRWDENDTPGALNTGEDGFHAVVTIDRSSAGQPGLLIIATEYEGGEAVSEVCVGVPDGWEFLRPVIQWLADHDSRNIGELG